MKPEKLDASALPPVVLLNSLKGMRTCVSICMFVQVHVSVHAQLSDSCNNALCLHDVYIDHNMSLPKCHNG